MRVRIIHGYDYFYVQTWRWWWPIWTFNSLSSKIDKARNIASNLKHPIIEEIL